MVKWSEYSVINRHHITYCTLYSIPYLSVVTIMYNYCIIYMYNTTREATARDNDFAQSGLSSSERRIREAHEHVGRLLEKVLLEHLQ